MASVNISSGCVEIRMSLNGAAALSAVLAEQRDQLTDALGSDYEGSGFERLTGAIDALTAPPLNGDPSPDRFRLPRGIPIDLEVDPARLLTRAVSITAQAMERRTGTAAEVMSQEVIALKESIEDWLSTGPDPDTVPLHLRPDAETAAILRSCLEATTPRLRREFGADCLPAISAMTTALSAEPGPLPASSVPVNPVLLLDSEAAEAMAGMIEIARSPEGPGRDEINKIKEMVRQAVEPDSPGF